MAYEEQVTDVLHSLSISRRAERNHAAIWRRFRIDSNATLPQMHRALQALMGWQDCHLHAFEVGGFRFGIPDPEFEDDFINERGVRLRSVSSEEKTIGTYVYDFGDDWRHELTLEAIEEVTTHLVNPEYLNGSLACPPEDVGGIGGYADFLEAISNRRHEDHTRMIKWIGGRFDPERLDTDRIARKLARIRVRGS